MTAAHQRYLRELLHKSGQYALAELAGHLLDRIPADCVFGFDDNSRVSVVTWQKASPYKLLVLRLGSLAGAAMLWDSRTSSGMS